MTTLKNDFILGYLKFKIFNFLLRSIFSKTSAVKDDYEQCCFRKVSITSKIVIIVRELCI